MGNETGGYHDMGDYGIRIDNMPVVSLGDNHSNQVNDNLLDILKTEKHTSTIRKKVNLLGNEKELLRDALSKPGINIWIDKQTNLVWNKNERGTFCSQDKYGRECWIDELGNRCLLDELGRKFTWCRDDWHGYRSWVDTVGRVQRCTINEGLAYVDGQRRILYNNHKLTEEEFPKKITDYTSDARKYADINLQLESSKGKCWKMEHDTKGISGWFAGKKFYEWQPENDTQGPRFLASRNM